MLIGKYAKCTKKKSMFGIHITVLAECQVFFVENSGETPAEVAKKLEVVM